MIGQFNFFNFGITPAPRGKAQVEVSFDIDENGILHVSAKDLATGKEQQVTITSSGGLSRSEIERMVQEGEEHREADAARRELARARSEADVAGEEAAQLLAETRGRLSYATIAHVDGAIAEHRAAAAAAPTPAEARAATEKLRAALLKIGEEVHAARGGGAAMSMRMKVSQEEADRMVKEAEANKEEDAKRRELAEAKNKAEDAMYDARGVLREHGPRVKPETLKKAEEALKACEEAAAGGTEAEAVRGATSRLLQAVNAIGAELYGGGPEDPQSRSRQ
eukprot:tig00020710_g13363.t1